MGKTSIEWVRGADGSEGMSWNALRAVTKHDKRSAHHCEHVNEACRFCYAERMNARLGGLPFKPGHRADYNFIVNEKTLREPLKRRKPTRYFVESMSDAFGDWWTDEQIDQIYAVMAICQRHTFINLSKRPERRRRYLGDTATSLPGLDVCTRIAYAAEKLGCDMSASSVRLRWPLPNVIEGTSVSCQAEADEFLPILLATKAAVRAVSCEPLLGPITLWRMDEDAAMRGCGIVRSGGVSVGTADNPPEGYDDSYPGLDWVIVGGESGPHARPMHPDWARSIRDQCAAAGVPFHFKQNGEWAPKPADYPDSRVSLPLIVWNSGTWTDDGGIEGEWLARVGKKAAGRLLDGVEHNGFPA